MNPNSRREIASRGGKSAHEKGVAHRFTPEEAREAGRIGGKKVSQDRLHMARIGSIGGSISARSDNHISRLKRANGKYTNEDGFEPSV